MTRIYAILKIADYKLEWLNFIAPCCCFHFKIKFKATGQQGSVK